MQIVGRRCEHCGVTVNVVLDAAACERCATIVHWRCASAAGGYRGRLENARCTSCGDALRSESRDGELRATAAALTDTFWTTPTLALFMALLRGGPEPQRRGSPAGRRGGGRGAWGGGPARPRRGTHPSMRSAPWDPAGSRGGPTPRSGGGNRAPRRDRLRERPP